VPFGPKAIGIIFDKIIKRITPKMKYTDGFKFFKDFL